jgi:hypothetical protein
MAASTKRNQHGRATVVTIHLTGGGLLDGLLDKHRACGPISSREQAGKTKPYDISSVQSQGRELGSHPRSVIILNAGLTWVTLAASPRSS